MFLFPPGLSSASSIAAYSYSHRVYVSFYDFCGSCCSIKPQTNHRWKERFASWPTQWCVWCWRRLVINWLVHFIYSCLVFIIKQCIAFLPQMSVSMVCSCVDQCIVSKIWLNVDLRILLWSPNSFIYSVLVWPEKMWLNVNQHILWFLLNSFLYSFISTTSRWFGAP